MSDTKYCIVIGFTVSMHYIIYAGMNIVDTNTSLHKTVHISLLNTRVNISED